jgi:DNA-binding response OmpR family regulator
MINLSQAMATVLIVSSDNPIGQSASQHLAAKGYDVVGATNATEGLRTLSRLEVDAIVFDTGVRDMSAADFSGWLRRQLPDRSVPLLFLVSPAQRWLPSSIPLRIGRDALLGKPFRPQQLEEALQPLLGAGTAPAPRTLSGGGLSLDRGLFALTGEAGTTTLTPTEFRLLEYLMERPGVVVSADELLEKVWGFFPHTGSRDIVRTHMRNLRAKIRHTTAGRDIVRTLPRRGYRFVA